MKANKEKAAGSSEQTGNSGKQEKPQGMAAMMARYGKSSERIQ